jgi:ribosomal protein S6--L-glutamate ligase
MKIGILSQINNSEDVTLFLRRAANRNINLQVLNPSSLAILLKNNRPVLLDSDMKPLQVQGIINWEPFPAYEELEQACVNLGIAFINSTEAVRTARNKMLTSIKLCRHGLPQPDTAYHHGPDINNKLLSKLHMPLVCKPKTGTQGRGALLFHSPEEFKLLHRARYKSSGFYLQSFVPNNGWDIRVVVVGGRVLGAIKKTAAPGEWRTHILHGGKAEAFFVDPKLEQLSLYTAQALGLHFAGIDVIVDKRDETYKILEVNAVPGLKVFLQATGVCIANAIIERIAECVECVE